jgi:nicotinamide-nucleotide adenylyltransferase
MFNRKNFTSTEVRRRLLTNGPWQKLVPRSVASYLRKIDGDERLRDISKSDRTS